MKILFAGDASNMHNSLAQQLRRMGHEATVASDGSRWMDTHRDINLLRRPGLVGTLRYLMDIKRALPAMTGYDIVEIASPIFLRLKPHRVAKVFDYLKAHNTRIVLSALATDMVYYDACHDGHTFRYNDYMLGDEPSPYVNSSEYIMQQQDNWKQPFMREHSDHIIGGIDGAVACLYEYYVAYQPVLGNRVAYGGIPIDTEAAINLMTINGRPVTNSYGVLTHCTTSNITRTIASKHTGTASAPHAAVTRHPGPIVQLHTGYQRAHRHGSGTGGRLGCRARVL